jgi:regulator of protease activity HflC (stomatin/prohibitin superfamily)
MRGLASKLVVAVIVLAVLFALAPFGTVPAGHRGVKTTFGNPSNEVLSEGIHFRWPLAQKINLVNVSIQREKARAMQHRATCRSCIRGWR